MSSTATVVASLPVPHVVGIARCGRSGPAGARPPPIGAFTYSMTGAGCETIRFATFAVSIAEPPPTETNPSTSASSAKSAAACSESSVGSTRDPSNTTTSQLDDARTDALDVRRCPGP